MQLNTNALLALQPLDAVGSFAYGQQAGAMQQQRVREQEYRNALAQYGAAAGRGDQAALNALAGFEQFGPQASSQVQANHLGMDATRNQMRISEEMLQIARQEAQQAAQAQAADISAQEAQAALAEMEAAMESALMIQDPAQWAQFTQTHGLGDVPFELRDMLISGFIGAMPVLDARAKQAEMAAGGAEDPAAFRALELRAQAAGLQPGTPEYQSFMANGGTPRNTGFRVETLPDGTTRITQGDLTEARPGRIDPAATQAMIDTIDGILNDPALDRATGIWSPLQAIPGTPQRRFAARARQLEGQAFLQAFESLRGGGQITEVEGIKGTQAIGRLDTAQSAEDYRQALLELKEILTVAQSRPAGWAQSQPETAPPAAEQPPATQADQSADIPPFPEEMRSYGVTPELWPGVWAAMPPEDKALFQ